MDKREAPETAVKYAVFIKNHNAGVKKVYLFGSYAKGTNHSDSDIDLAIVFDELADDFNTQVELMKIRRKFDTRIEPHPISEADFNSSNPLANEILKNGMQIA